MNNPEEITECIAQAIQQRTASEILATMGTKVLTQQNFQQFIRKYNKNISYRAIDEYYDNLVSQNNSKYGITLEIFLKLIDSIPQPIQRTNIVINLVERIKQKKVSLDRIFEFFDKNKTGYLKGDDLREMFEYIYPKITEQEYKTVLKNNQQIQFSLESLKTLLQYEQNANAEIIIVKSNIESHEDDDQEQESNESDESDYEEEFSEDLYPENSPYYEEYVKFREFYNKVKESKQKFVDEQFPPNQSSLGSVGNSKYQWKRLSQVWKNADVFKSDLYHNKSEPGLHSLVSPRDIKQGTLIIGNIVCAGTYNEHKDYEKLRLVPNHAYSVLNFKTIILPDKSVNPYGNEMEWKGDWRDFRSIWTQESKDNVLKHQEDEGIFFMLLSDFLKYFDSIFLDFVNHSIVKVKYQQIIKKESFFYCNNYQKSY